MGSRLAETFLGPPLEAEGVPLFEMSIQCDSSAIFACAAEEEERNGPDRLNDPVEKTYSRNRFTKQIESDLSLYAVLKQPVPDEYVTVWHCTV